MTKYLALFACLCLVAAAHAADWSSFRGPGSSGVSEEKNLPTTWSATENVIWKTDLPGPGSSSPAVWGERVFITCYTGYGIDENNPGNQEDLKRHLLCLDRTSGKAIWEQPLAAKLPEPEFQGFQALHGYASSTPATDGERVYVFYGKSGVLAYDFAGKEVWRADVGSRDHNWGSGTSPLLYKELVIVNAAVESGSLVALDRRTGQEQWRTSGIRGCWGSPALVDVPGGEPELVLNLPNTMKGFDPDTGSELWQCQGISESYLCPTVVSKDGVVYAIGARANASVAVKAGGMDDVSDTRLVWSKRGGSNVTSPALFGEHLYWVNDQGMAFCVSTATGEQVYQQRLRGRVYASVTIADGKLFVVSQTGGTYVLAAGPKFEQLAQNTLGDTSVFNASPVISRGQLLLRSNKALYCIGQK